MKIKYDLHTHSGLSPCADKDMTPANIVGFAAINVLNMIAIADHNSIKNVKVALRIGEAYGVTVVPAFELQTAEEIHILCLFDSYDNLEKFFSEMEFLKVKNKPDIFGHQYLYDEDDNIIGEEENLLLTSAVISSSEVSGFIRKYGGVAVPAHIDRESNGMLQILGAITPEFRAVEFSSTADKKLVETYADKYRIIVDSDSHTLNTINLGSEIELKENSATALLDYLRGKD